MSDDNGYFGGYSGRTKVPSTRGHPQKLTLGERRRLKHSLHGQRVASLTRETLEAWRNSLIPATRDPEGRRRAQASANRIWTPLRAALNRAFENEKAASDDACRRLKPFRNVDRPVTRFLSAAECNALLDACDGDFGALCRGCAVHGVAARGTAGPHWAGRRRGSRPGAQLQGGNGTIGAAQYRRHGALRRNDSGQGSSAGIVSAGGRRRSPTWTSRV